MSLNGKVILITGGTGSFGKKFTEIVLKNYHPEKLIVFSRDELKQSEMRQIYREDDYPSLRYFIGDVRDKERLNRAMNGVDYVVHAAALKQVPSCEYNPFEAVKTNIIGAENVINTAIDNGVQKVIAISTDKAVNPVNLYGATKLTAEKMFTQGNSYSGEGGTKFSCARYGNVVGSRGSIIPLFKKQKEKGILTITDKRMTRFWITIEEGVKFVIKCIETMKGGEIFVPKIPSVKLVDIARCLAPEAKLKFIGIRPGEKINEVLVTEEESRHALEFKNFFLIEPEFSWWKKPVYQGAKKLKEGFRYTSDTNDWWLTKEEIKSMLSQ